MLIVVDVVFDSAAYSVLRLRRHPQLLDPSYQSQQRRLDRGIHRPYRSTADDARVVLWGVRGQLAFIPKSRCEIKLTSVQFWCSTIKVFTLTGLMIMALVIDAGGGPNHGYIGFRVSTYISISTAIHRTPG